MSSLKLLEPEETEEAVPRILERLVRQAEEVGASDVHLQMGPESGSLVFRLDGVLSPAVQLPLRIAERLCGRIKYLARLKTYQESLPQDGRIERAELKSACDLRVATYPTVTGEKIVLRLFNPSIVQALDELAFPETARAQLNGFLGQTSGLLLLTGPAGSGKTTTIYSCLRELAQQGGRHIITVEDPVEQIITGVMQTEVNEARGLDYARAARHLLRQDPQVLALGEIRDEETANIAVRAALTGHLVISTLHAGSCRGVFERLLALCADASAVAAAVELVLNQRLLRRLCMDCGGKGCAGCLFTGYRGRVLAVEWLRFTVRIRQQVAARNLEEVQARPTLRERAARLVASGLTRQTEVERVLGTSWNGPLSSSKLASKFPREEAPEVLSNLLNLNPTGAE